MDINEAGDQATKAAYHKPGHPKDHFTFESCPLTDPGDVRVLCLLPGRLESPIECTLSTHSLMDATKHNQNRKYLALSYVWDQGEPTDSIKIHTSGHSAGVLYIMPNLHAALRHLRDIKSVRVLWIDAICIDKANIQEQNHQVSLMADVYRRAEHVCVWLGQRSDDSDKALDFIGGAVDSIATSARAQREPDWRAFYSFISRPWFRHRWAIQAIALARNATLICGERTVGWHELASALSIVQEVMTEFSNDKVRFNDYDEWGHMSLQPAFRLAEIRNNVHRVPGDVDDIGSLWSLETLMWKFQDFETSDPRDAIYALLALAKDRRLISPDFYSLTHLPIDYYRLYPDVCKNYISSTIKISGSLDVLCRPWKPYEERIKVGSVATPSWLPQNSSITFGHSIYGKYGRINADVMVGPPNPGKRYYNASGSVPVTNACRFGTGIKDNSMFVEGVVVDAIAKIQPAALCGNERSALHDGVPNNWRAAGGWMQSAKEPPDVYWRTLVADRGPNGNGTPDFYPVACKEQANRYYRVANNYYWDWDATPMSRATDALVVKFVHRVQEVVLNRRLVNTEHGRLGLAPKRAKKSDLVCLLGGCSVPIVLRPQQDAGTGEGYFQFIGECYIHGIMEGEALELARRGSGNDTIPKQEFEVR